jgi:hypothetical protein
MMILREHDVGGCRNENIVDLEQRTSYGDITIRATANTAMYAFA